LPSSSSTCRVPISCASDLAAFAFLS
jgi:hypothetical protein